MSTSFWNKSSPGFYWVVRWSTFHPHFFSSFSFLILVELEMVWAVFRICWFGFSRKNSCVDDSCDRNDITQLKIRYEKFSCLNGILLRWLRCFCTYVWTPSYCLFIFIVAILNFSYRPHACGPQARSCAFPCWPDRYSEIRGRKMPLPSREEPRVSVIPPPVGRIVMMPPTLLRATFFGLQVVFFI